jgi:hypothetical protein
MEITKEMLEKKKDELLQKREAFLGQTNAMNGALECIDFCLDVLEMPHFDAKKEEKTENVDTSFKDSVLKVVKDEALRGVDFRQIKI